MRHIEEMRQSFEKHDYIDGMYNNFHSKLFSYASWLPQTNIARIEIGGEVVMTSRDNGLKIICPKFDQRVAPIEILKFGDYEATHSNMIMRLVKPNSCILDIGANIGWYALNIAKQNPNAKIYAFEPIKYTYLALEKNIKLNNLTNIKSFNFCFSSEEKTLEFYFYPEGSGSASLANLSGRPDIEKITRDVKVIDKFSTTLNLPKIDFIKCDVERAELFVLKGALTLLGKDKSVVFTEMLRKWAAKFNYHPNEIIELFRELGYKCFTANKKGQLHTFISNGRPYA